MKLVFAFLVCLFASTNAGFFSHFKKEIARHIYVSEQVPFLGRTCTYERHLERVFKAKYSTTFFCPGYNAKGRGRSSSPSGSILEAQQDLVKQLVAKNSITPEDAQPYL